MSYPENGNLSVTSVLTKKDWNRIYRDYYDTWKGICKRYGVRETDAGDFINKAFVNTEEKAQLGKFTYKSDHVEIFARRAEWFSKITDMHMAFWFVPKGHIPTPSEARERLEYVNAQGETPYAFTFKKRFTVEDFLNYNHLVP